MLVCTLFEQDYVNLMGRVALVPTEMVAACEHRVRNPTCKFSGVIHNLVISLNQQTLAQFIGNWSAIVDQFHGLSLKMESAKKPGIGMFSKSYDDWSKVLAFIASQQSAHLLSQGDPYQKYIRSLWSSWVDLGTAMNYLQSPEVWEPCAYSRCADPTAMYWDDGAHLVCTGCLVSRYCSKECQSAWVHSTCVPRDLRLTRGLFSHRHEHIAVCVPPSKLPPEDVIT